MDDKTFFRYYIPALEKALSEDDINGGYGKGPDWYYPQDNEIYRAMDNFEDANLDKFPILDMVEGYFDSRSHNFPDVGNISVDECRDRIVEEMKKLTAKYDMDL
jgi:hypothetical protein